MRTHPPAPPLLDDVDAHPWQVLLSPRGRVGRRTWWWYGVALPAALGLLLVALLGIAGLASTSTDAALKLALLWPVLAVSTKRLQDQGYAPWWVLAVLLLVVLVPVAGWAVLLVFNGLLPGTPGPNRHGAVPGSPGADALGLPLPATAA